MGLLIGWNDFVSDFLPELIELRRHFHAHPELSGQEHQTAALVAGELRRYGWRVTEAVGKTGVLAEFGQSKGPFVGVRVDMDALPVEEQTDLEYSSISQGLMHACGHDLHICIGLGVAKLLSIQPPLDGGVRLLFQPAEEIAKGARWMRSEGAVEGLDALFGLHVFPELPVGTIGLKSGCLTAAAGELSIDVIGEGGHGARPHQSVDSIWVASRVVSGLQEAIARQLDALTPVVISFGKIQGGRAFNVIADRVTLLGTVRCLDPDFNKTLPKWIEDTVQSICLSFGARAVVQYRSIAPPVYNDPELTSIIEVCAKKILGNSNVITLEKPSLGAEDFAELLQPLKGSMFRLGVAGQNGCAPLHSGQFAPQERSLPIGIQVLTSTVLSWIEKNSSYKDRDR